MKYNFEGVLENELCNFNAWGKSEDNLAELLKHPEAYEFISDYLEEVCDRSPCFLYYDYDINNFLWDEMFDLLEENGFMDEFCNWID